MDFASYVSRSRVFGIETVTEDQLRKLARLFERNTTLEELVSRYGAELELRDPDSVEHVRQIWHEYRTWLAEVRALSASRLERDLRLLPDDAIGNTWSGPGLNLISSLDEALGDGEALSHATWRDGLGATVARWGRLFQAVWPVATATTPGGDAQMCPEEILGRQCVDGLSTADLIWRWPEGTTETARATRQPALEPISEALGGAEALDRFLMDRLPDALTATTAMLTRIAATRMAASRYTDLLSIDVVTSQHVRCIWVGKRATPTGVALLGRGGKVARAEALDADDLDGLLDWLDEAGTHDDAIVLPELAEDMERLERIASGLDADAPVARIPVTALAYQLDTLSHHSRALPQVRAAICLGQRAMDPRTILRQIPRDRLGLVPPSLTLPSERLETAIEERATHLFGAPPPPPQPASGGRSAGGQNSAAPPSDIRQLQKGMVLQGRVSRLNRLGAFVNVGLPDDGLIPAEGLPQERKQGGAKALRKGQTIQVEVLKVDVDRKRIRMKLASSERSGRRRRGRRRGAKGGRRGRRSGTSQAQG